MFQSLSLNEKEFIEESVAQNFRVAARGRNQHRPIDVRFGDQNGQVLLSIGRTKVLGTSTIKVVQPGKSKPNEGFFAFNVELDSLAQASEASGGTQQASAIRGDL